MGSDNSLVIWQPPECEMFSFPLARQKAKIHDVAAKLLKKKTRRHANAYRSQISDALTGDLGRLKFSQIEQNRMIGAFWRAVELEMARLRCRGQRP